MSGIGGMVAQGMAFGTGSAIAHRAVGAVASSFGSSGESEAPQAPVQQNPCLKNEGEFLQCLRTNNNDIAACQFYFDSLNECQRMAQGAQQF